MTYRITPQSNGSSEVSFQVTQSNVSPGFKMPVRIYMALADRVAPLARVNLSGNSTSAEMKATIPMSPKELILNYNYDVLALESATDRVK